MGMVFSRLRVLMAENGLNIQKVKDKTTLSRTTISNLYNNYGVGVQFDTLAQLCELLNCTPGELFEYSEIDATFEIAEEDSLVFFSNEEEHDGVTYTSNLSVTLQLNCYLHYNGESSFGFVTDLSVDLDHNKEVKSLSIVPSRLLENYLDSYKLSFFEKEYVVRELNKFLEYWIEEYVQIKL
jgi:DNA-binding Xre family transcriptional regulator